MSALSPRFRRSMQHPSLHSKQGQTEDDINDREAVDLKRSNSKQQKGSALRSDVKQARDSVQIQHKHQDQRHHDTDVSHVAVENFPAAMEPARASTEALTAEDFEEFMRDVAARIIQTYWRKWYGWRLQVRAASERATLHRLMQDLNLDLSCDANNSSTTDGSKAEALSSIGDDRFEQLAKAMLNSGRHNHTPDMSDAPPAPMSASKAQHRVATGEPPSQTKLQREPQAATPMPSMQQEDQLPAPAALDPQDQPELLPKSLRVSCAGSADHSRGSRREQRPLSAAAVHENKDIGATQPSQHCRDQVHVVECADEGSPYTVHSLVVGRRSSQQQGSPAAGGLAPDGTATADFGSLLQDMRKSMKMRSSLDCALGTSQFEQESAVQAGVVEGSAKDLWQPAGQVPAAQQGAARAATPTTPKSHTPASQSSAAYRASSRYANVPDSPSPHESPHATDRQHLHDPGDGPQEHEQRHSTAHDAMGTAAAQHYVRSPQSVPIQRAGGTPINHPVPLTQSPKTPVGPGARTPSAITPWTRAGSKAGTAGQSPQQNAGPAMTRQHITTPSPAPVEHEVGQGARHPAQAAASSPTARGLPHAASPNTAPTVAGPSAATTLGYRLNSNREATTSDSQDLSAYTASHAWLPDSAAAPGPGSQSSSASRALSFKSGRAPNPGAQAAQEGPQRTPGREGAARQSGPSAAMRQSQQIDSEHAWRGSRTNTDMRQPQQTGSEHAREGSSANTDMRQLQQIGSEHARERSRANTDMQHPQHISSEHAREGSRARTDTNQASASRQAAVSTPVLAAAASGQGRTVGGAVAGLQPGGDGALDPAGSLTAEKLNSILQYLDNAEQQAEEEAATLATCLADPVAPSGRSTSLGLHHRSPSRAASSVHPPHHGLGHASRDPYATADDAVSLAGSVGGLSCTSAGHKSTLLAESVYDGVKAKIRNLKDEVRNREDQVAQLQRRLQTAEAQHCVDLLDAEARMQEALVAQRGEFEAGGARHLAFIDRLLADKDELATRAAALSAEVKAMETKQERAIAALKDGWAVELKKQRDGWAASERSRREQWEEVKSKEIKELTIKGMEVEVQRLLQRHRAELARVQEVALEDSKRQLDAASSQHEAHMRQARERWAKEQEEAMERERSMAQNRLREASERYEQQLQAQRLRLVADFDARMEQAEAGHRAERRRMEEAADKTARTTQEREQQLLEDFKREKEALRKVNDRALAELRDNYEAGQEGWRAALAERARRELAEREEGLKQKLAAERDEQLEAVVQRLEAEAQAAREALRQEFQQREDAAAVRHNAALRELKKNEARLAERFKAAVETQRGAEEEAASAEEHLKEARRELESRARAIGRLEAQVSAAKEERQRLEAEAQSMGQAQQAAVAEAVTASWQECQQLAAQLQTTTQELEELRSRKAGEMSHLEARVRATLARKDESIAGLKEQLALVQQRLATTEAVLAQQQYELDN